MMTLKLIPLFGALLVACGGEEFAAGPVGLAEAGSGSGGRLVAAGGTVTVAGSGGASDGGAGSAAGGTGGELASGGATEPGGVGGAAAGGTISAGGATAAGLTFTTFDQKVLFPVGRSAVTARVTPPVGYPSDTAILRCTPSGYGPAGNGATVKLTLGAFSAVATEKFAIAWAGMPLVGTGALETDTALSCSVGY